MVREFLVESYEVLDQVDSELVELEANPDDTELLAAIFRGMHTIKGTCGFLGFGRLERVAHHAENLLSALRDRQCRLTEAMTTALLRVVDAIREILATIEKHGAEGESGDDEICDLLERLRDEGLRGPLSTPAPVSAPRLREDEQSAEPEYDEDEPIPAIGVILVESGRATLGDVRRAVAAQKAGDPRRLGEILVGNSMVSATDVLDALDQQSTTKLNSVADNCIRVDVSLLDSLMNLVGELVLARNQLNQHTRAHTDTILANTAQRLSLITSELQEGVMKTRMQPVGFIWGKFPRIVRHLSIVCSKKVRVEMSGESTELDRTIIEAIKDPLTHVIRNAVDHGIEEPSARVAAGKPAEGVLRLRAFHEGGQVNMEISDDGRGIDPDQCRARALEAGLISPGEASAISDRDARDLVFRPGFSTAAQITSVSGRGVGMDVVRTNIERIGGSVDIDSQLGQGTTLRIKIPLTLAIIPALIVNSSGHHYAIPQVNLLELVRLEPGDGRAGVEWVDDSPVYRLRGSLLPLVCLDRVLEGVERPAEAATNIVVLQSDSRTFGLVVDEILDTAEIVVKPLAKQIKSIEAFAGAAILGDGTVALILDVNGVALCADMQTQSAVSPSRRRQPGRDSPRARGQRLLLFKVGEERRVAIPLSRISRLEEIPTSSIEDCGGHFVAKYRGRLLPVVDLEAEMGGGRELAPGKMARVLVFQNGASAVGLRVDQIMDIVEASMDYDESFASHGILGSLVLEGQVTEVLDVDTLLHDSGLIDTGAGPQLASAA